MERFVYNLKSLKFLLSCEYKDCQQNKDFSYVLILWKVKMSFIKLVRCRGQKNVFDSMKKQKVQMVSSCEGKSLRTSSLWV